MTRNHSKARQAFFAVVDALDVPRQQQRRMVAALKKRLRAMSEGEIEEFQHGFDCALAELRTPELWSAMNLVHEAADPHDFDAFAAWLAMQGTHALQRALRDSDAVIAAMTRAPFGRRYRPRFDDVLGLAREIYGERFDRDLYDRVAPPRRAALEPLTDGAEKGERWAHPGLLEEHFPQLWRAFAARGRRLFPWIDEDDDICSCCGSVHRYGYGLFSDGGQPFGSWTLHFVESAPTRIDSIVIFEANEGPVAFALRHQQYKSRSGIAVLDREDAPFEPEQARLLGADEARAHPLYRHALDGAKATYLKDPRTAEFRRFWWRRTNFAELTAMKLERPPPAAGTRCDCCGEVHEETELSHRLPDALVRLDAWQWRHRVRDEGDVLVFDGTRRFERGLLPLPVAGRDDAYRIGIWIERLDPSRGTRLIDGDAAQRRLQRGVSGCLANDLLFVEHSTLGLHATVHPRDEGQRSYFLLDDDDHPLVGMQRDGVAEDLPRRLTSLVSEH